MKHCKNCGKQIPDIANFCPECGKLADMTVPQEGMEKKKSNSKAIILCAVAGALIFAIAAGFGIYFLYNHYKGTNDIEQVNDYSDYQEDAEDEFDDVALTLSDEIYGVELCQSDAEIRNNTETKINIIEVQDSKRLKADTVTATMEGFYETYPDDYEPDAFYVIDANQLCLHGTLHYADELTKKEKKNFGHGGELFDENGNEYTSDELSFYSDYDEKIFLIDLPEDIPTGSYTAVIDQCLGDEQECILIRFEVI